MSSRLRGSDLVDTVPGRNFVAGFARDFDRDAQDLSINEFLRGLSMDTLLWEAQKDISTYLYGTGMDDALQVNTRDPAIVAMAAAIVEELGSPTRDTFTSPQRHSGRVETLAPPSVRNRTGSTEVLPDGALWTATTLDDGVDTWTHSRESEPEFVYELLFAPTSVKVARIDSHDDWRRLITAHTRHGSDTSRPDWKHVAQNLDAVHLSLAGLLAAHPRLSEVPPNDSRDGYRHSQSSPWAGVGHWSTVSTAWMRLPHNYEWNALHRFR